MTVEEFLTSQAVINEAGDLQILVNGQPNDIMFASEQAIVEQGVDLIFESNEINSVIEIGFGLGYTAQKFQDYGVQKHYILEPHPQIYEMALVWRETQANKDNIFIFNKFFQEWDRRDGEVMIRADLVYYDVADFIDSIPDFVNIVAENKQVYFKWADIMVAGYARENCYLSSWLDKYEFSLNNKNYIQPYKLVNN